MAEILGRLSTIVKYSVTIARMRSFNVTINGEVIDVTEFGDSWINNSGGIRSFSASIEGMIDLTSHEQDELRTAAEQGTKLTDVELWVDSTGYFECDLVVDPDCGMYISNYTVTSDNKNVASFTCTITGTGEITWNDNP